MLDYALAYGLVPPRCPECGNTSKLLRCGGCKVVSYCGSAHQSANRAEHKAACNAIKKSQETLEREESKLRNSPADPFLPADVFNTCVGRFWGILGTRDYMRARNAAANRLLKVNTASAVEKALEHFTEMLRLCRSDNIGVRDIIPFLLLRLGREQECYDFLKWWGVVGGDDNYDWSNTRLPYLDIHGADPFEDINASWTKTLSLSHLVALTLLKLRLRLDLEAYGFDLEAYDFDPFSPELDRPVGKLVRNKIENSDTLDLMSTTVVALKDQYLTLCQTVQGRNPHFWPTLVQEDDEEDEYAIESYSCGSEDEAKIVTNLCRRAWEESEDAITMVEADTSHYTPVYVSPGISPAMGNTRLSGSPEWTQDREPMYVGPLIYPAMGTIRPPVQLRNTEPIEKRRGTGVVFPSRFKPEPPASDPSVLFPPTCLDRHRIIHFLNRNDHSTALVYVDGACANNGQQDPRAGWAVTYGGPVGEHNDFSTVSGPLERKGPFGDQCQATSNRAELRASIAALRLWDWRAEGFNNLVIATDSSYVVDGATGWTKGWVRNGWRTATGGNVKNRDLWELLLGEVERWKENGLGVQFWKIPREMNVIADAAAKKSTAEMAVVLDFSDPAIGHSYGPRDAQPSPHVLALCLDSEQAFTDCCASLLSKIRSKATLELATTGQAALSFLNQEPPPSIILIADGALTRKAKIWERVIDLLRSGATVVVAGLFSSMVNEGEFNRFFAKLGLPWKRGSYYRTEVRLQRTLNNNHIVCRRQLPSVYSQKALYVKSVKEADVWYRGDDPDEAAVVFSKVESGNLGYIGDVNCEESSNTVVLAMCGLLE